MSFNTIISSEQIRSDFHPSTKILSKIHQEFQQTFGCSWDKSLPLTHKNGTNEFKLSRAFDHRKVGEILSSTFDVTRTKRGFVVREGGSVVFKLTEGEGSRNFKAGGRTGRSFEQSLYESLLIGSTCQLHGDIIKQIEQMIGDSVTSYEPELVGSRNNKRNLVFRDNKIQTDSGEIGSVVSDITLYGETPIHLSLKWTSRHYLCNMSLRKYLHTDKPDVDVSERNRLVKFLGFRPTEFFEPYCLASEDESLYSREQVEYNWRSLIQDVVGHGYLYVQGGTEETVLDYRDPPKVEVLSIEEPMYAINGVRKYSRINLVVNIGGRRKTLECQLRGTEASDVLPYYMRICVR